MSFFGSRNYYYEIAATRITGTVAKNASGINEDVDTGTLPEDIWAEGGIWVPPTAARIHDIVSTSASDSAAGTGTRSVLVQGLNSSWELQQEVVAMNGTTNVPTVNSYTRIHGLTSIPPAGSNMKNVGIIRATAQTDATVQAHMPIGWGRSAAAIYSTPLNKKVIVTDIFITSNNLGGGATGDIADFDLIIRLGASTANPVELITNRLGVHTRATSNKDFIFNIPSAVPAGVDLVIRAPMVTSNDTSLTAAFGFSEEDV